MHGLTDFCHNQINQLSDFLYLTINLRGLLFEHILVDISMDIIIF